MIVHLVDGTYELFRQHFGRRDSGEFSATVGVLGSTLALIEDGATHVGVATDHVIESFRNDMWAGYKTSDGMDPELLMQIPVLADALEAMGVMVWRGLHLEADDLLASAASVARSDHRVRTVRILSPDKDLGQCVVDPVVVQVDRRNDVVFDEAGIRERLGVAPTSVPDLLALVGDTADGFPGLPGWGAKSASTVLAEYGHLENIPADVSAWSVAVRGAQKLNQTLRDQWDLALLFREIATTRVESDLVGGVDDWCWDGARPDFAEFAERLGRPQLVARAHAALSNQRR